MSDPRTFLIPVRAELGTTNKVKSDWRTIEPTARELLAYLDAARLEIVRSESELASVRKELAEVKNELHMRKNHVQKLQREIERTQKLSNEHVSVAQKLEAAKALTPTVVVKKVRVVKKD